MTPERRAAEWSPWRKWWMGIFAGVITFIVITIIILDHQDEIRHRVQVESRLDVLERFSPPIESLPSVERQDITVLEIQLYQLRQELTQLSNDLARHLHFAPRGLAPKILDDPREVPHP